MGYISDCTKFSSPKSQTPNLLLGSSTGQGLVVSGGVADGVFGSHRAHCTRYEVYGEGMERGETAALSSQVLPLPHFVHTPLAVGGAPGPEPDLEAGDAVLLADCSGTVIGWGVFNPVSMFRVR